MNRRINAIFEHGVFRPEEPVAIADGEHVSLSIRSRPSASSELSDVADLLDMGFMESCRQRSGDAPPLDQVRQVLGAFNGSLAERICAERDER